MPNSQGDDIDQSNQERLDALHGNDSPEQAAFRQIMQSGSIEEKGAAISKAYAAEAAAQEIEKLFATIPPIEATTIGELGETDKFVEMKLNDVKEVVGELEETRAESVGERPVNEAELPPEAKAVVQEIEQSTKDINGFMQSLGTATVEIIGIGLLGMPGLESLCAGIKRSAADMAEYAPEWKEQAKSWAAQGLWAAADAVIDLLTAAVKCLRFITSVFTWCSEKIHHAGKAKDSKPTEDRAQTTLDKGSDGAKAVVQDAAKVSESVFKIVGGFLTGVAKSLEALSDKLQDKVEQNAYKGPQRGRG